MVRGPCFPGNDFLFKCIYKSCDDELELFMPVNSGINLSGDVSQPLKRRWSSAVEGDTKAPFSLVAFSGK